MTRILLFVWLLVAPLWGAISARTASANVAAGIGANVTITSPTGTTTGDVLVLAYSERANVDAVTAVANGANSFTKLTFYASGVSNINIGIWYRVVQAGDPSTWTVTNTGNIETALMAYVGVDTSTPIDTTGAGTATNQQLPSITTATANAWYIGVHAFNAATSGNVTPNASFTERADAGNGGTTSTRSAVWLGDAPIASAGPTGTFADTTVSTSVGYGFALRASGAAPAASPEQLLTLGVGD